MHGKSIAQKVFYLEYSGCLKIYTKNLIHVHNIELLNENHISNI